MPTLHIFRGTVFAMFIKAFCCLFFITVVAVAEGRVIDDIIYAPTILSDIDSVNRRATVDEIIVNASKQGREAQRDKVDEVIAAASKTSGHDGVQGRSTIDEVITNASRTGRQESVDMRDSRSTHGTLYEGDMLLTDEQEKLLHGNSTKRNALRDTFYRWPNNVIPYYITPNVFTSDEVKIIEAAISEWEQRTCLDFQLKQSCAGIANCIIFVDGKGCQSYVGKINGHQNLMLQKLCRRHEIIMHELGHAIGFHHEQTRPDRDSYVSVHLANVKDGMERNFDKYTSSLVNSFGVPYDYHSVMHYGPYYFSKNGQKTITTKENKYDDIIGRAKTVSFSDVKMANLMYNCAPKSCLKTCPADGFLDKNCNCQCPGSPTELCSGPAVTFLPTTQPPTTTNKATLSVCVDYRIYCATWKRYGFCLSTHRLYRLMVIYCKKSCNLCHMPCADYNDACPTYKSKSLCAYPLYKSWIFAVCPKSCGTCTGG